MRIKNVRMAPCLDNSESGSRFVDVLIGLLDVKLARMSVQVIWPCRYLRLRCKSNLTNLCADLDEAWQRVYQKAKSPGFNELARYEEFLRRELPSAVRRELELAVEREFSPVEERLKSQLVEIVRDLQLQLFQTYTRSRNTEPTTARYVYRDAHRSMPWFYSFAR